MLERRALQSGIAVGLAMMVGLTALAQTPITFEERVKAQEAIERVYFAHRIWPKDNAQPKPSFEKLVLKSSVEAKVEDYLRSSQLLDEQWHRPVTADQLQAEMNRMASRTQAPEMLHELFSAVGNDPLLIAECLARPALADRLLRKCYESDEKLHRGVRARAEAALIQTRGAELSTCGDGDYQRRVYVLDSEGRNTDLKEGTSRSEVRVGKKRFEQIAEDSPNMGQPAQLRETSRHVLVIHTLYRSSSRVEVETLAFRKVSFEDWFSQFSGRRIHCLAPVKPCSYVLPTIAPSSCVSRWENGILDDVPEPREGHTAVWTGTEMIVWGGDYQDNPGDGYVYPLNSGGRYNPATDSWTPTSTGEGCPAPRPKHTAVWTGTEMIVWGGFYNDNRVAFGDLYFDSGGRYNPVSDSWVPTSTGSGCPLARYGHTAVWTGTEMIIWGGMNARVPFFGLLDSGARYDPGTDTWTALSSTTSSPSAREGHQAVWTGSEMIVWGGWYYDIHGGHLLNTGARYSPSTNSWIPTSTGQNCPSSRDRFSAVWTGTEMVVWGGYEETGLDTNTGARYDPIFDQWTPTSTGINCPPGNSWHSAIWTGEEMIIWGGAYLPELIYLPLAGGRYNPLTDSWRTVSMGFSSAGIHCAHTAVWTGREMIIWGGNNRPGYGRQLNTGSRYSPSTDTWLLTSTGASWASDTVEHTSVWTGAEVITWGGLTYDGVYQYVLSEGARYNPVTDDWVLISTGNGTPEPRTLHTAVWTGTEMIIWGGETATPPYFVNSGGRYRPDADSWLPTEAGSECPDGRELHTAVWTGSEMIVWGGGYYEVLYNGGLLYHPYSTGGRYDPRRNTWVPTPTGAYCPAGRLKHSGVWTGTEMVIWGGMIQDPYWEYLNSGGRYNPSTDSWSPTSTGPYCPSGRGEHSTVWTGKEMIVWGGEGGYAWNVLSSGGRYDPRGDSWSPTAEGEGCPSARESHSAVWSGAVMIVWGGMDFYNYYDDGGIYDPLTDAWTSISSDPNTPERRAYQTATWTNSGMVVMGGYHNGFLSSGGRYLPPLKLSPSVLHSGVLGAPYHMLLAGYHGTAPYVFSLVSGNLPPGLDLRADGILSGVPVEEGNFEFTISAGDASECAVSQAYDLSIHPSCAPLLLQPDSIPAGLAATCYPATSFTQMGGDGSVDWVEEGVLPAGMVFSGGILAGTPREIGSFPFSVTATDANGCSGGRNYTLAVACGSLTLLPITLLGGAVGEPYSLNLTASGGVEPYTISAVSGSLPPGLSLSSQGEISGTPMAAGAFSFIAQVNDANGCSTEQTYTINVLLNPRVSSIKKGPDPFRILVVGDNLQNGIRVFIDDAEWTSLVWKSAQKIVLTGGKLLKLKVPKGSVHLFRFVNPDGGAVSQAWER